MRLEACLAEVSAVLPALAGRVVAEGPAFDDAAAQAPALLAAWQQAHPEAGPLYWASRSWGMLVWQPAYLCVLSVHLAGALPALDGLRQDRTGGNTGGFSLPSRAPRVGDVPSLILAGGRMLQGHWPRWFAQLARHRPYPRTLAACLLADCLNAALLMLPQARAGWSAARLQEASAQWLSASGLAGHGGLLSVAMEEGKTALDLERRACCQHFRRADGAPCSTCPRRARAQRQALLCEQPACVV